MLWILISHILADYINSTEIIMYVSYHNHKATKFSLTKWNAPQKLAPSIVRIQSLIIVLGSKKWGEKLWL